jgi:DNA-binding Lrp family transcriptional regulator
MNDRAANAPIKTELRVCGKAPFCWQHKGALRKIREAFDAEKTVASALAVYLALTEIASDEEREVFQTTHAWISQKSGVSPRTVQDRLNGLAEIGVVQIITPALKSPSTYWLLPVSQPLPNARQRTKTEPPPSSEEQKKNTTKNIKIVKRPLTKLTASAASMECIARDIASNKNGWSYDNCKVKPDRIVAASLKKVLQAHADKLTEKTIHECWQEAVTRAHGATVDQLADNPLAYCVGCFKEQLKKAEDRALT